MDELLNNLQIYGDERAVVMLFAGIVGLCTGIMCAVAVTKALGKRVLVALVLATALVVIVYRVTQ